MWILNSTDRPGMPTNKTRPSAKRYRTSWLIWSVSVTHLLSSIESFFATTTSNQVQELTLLLNSKPKRPGRLAPLVLALSVAPTDTSTGMSMGPATDIPASTDKAVDWQRTTTSTSHLGTSHWAQVRLVSHRLRLSRRRLLLHVARHFACVRTYHCSVLAFWDGHH